MTPDDATPTSEPLPEAGEDSNTPLAFALAELARYDRPTQEALARQLREQSERLRQSGRRQLEEARPARQRPKPPAPAKTALGLTAALVLVLGFLGFWYGMIVGVPRHTVAPGGHASPAWDAVRYAWCALLTWMLVRDLRRDRLAEAWAVARQVTPAVLAQNVLLVAATVAVGLSLLHLFPALDRSWLYLLPDVGFHGHAGNIGLLPVQIKYFGTAFLLLFAVSIPRLARSEEMSYRQGTRNWRHGAWRSLRFGLTHCLMGIPLYAGLALTVGGLWFTLQYFRGGVERSTLHHAAYNWVITAILVVVVTLGSLH